MCGLSFEVSPPAFFQVNTRAAEQLYEEATSWALSEAAAEKDDDAPVGAGRTLVLDVCCGSGAIGLTVARRAARVVGLEINEQAVLDARANAERNGVHNAEFFAGRAELTINTALRKYLGKSAEGEGFDEVVAIVDPPRGGLHLDVLRALRSTRQVRHRMASKAPKSGFITFYHVRRRSQTYFDS